MGSYSWEKHSSLLFPLSTKLVWWPSKTKGVVSTRAHTHTQTHTHTHIHFHLTIIFTLIETVSKKLLLVRLLHPVILPVRDVIAGCCRGSRQSQCCTSHHCSSTAACLHDIDSLQCAVCQRNGEGGRERERGGGENENAERWIGREKNEWDKNDSEGVRTEMATGGKTWQDGEKQKKHD